MSYPKPLLAMIAIAGAVASVHAASGPGGLIAGFTVDSRSHAIRPVYGMPGAQTLGPEVRAAVKFTRLVSSAANNFAIAVGVNNALYVVHNLRNEPQLSPTGVTIADVNSLVVSGSFAAAFDDGGIVVMSGLPDHLMGVFHVALPGAGGSFRTLALDDTNRVLLVGIGDGTTGSLYRGGWEAAASWTFVQSFPAPASLSVLPGGDGAVLLDAAGPTVWVIRGLSTSSFNSAQLAGSADGLSASAKMLYLENSQRVALVNSSNLLLLDPARGDTPTSMPLPVAPTRFELIGRDSAALTFADGNPIYMLDLQSEPYSYFIPAN